MPDGVRLAARIWLPRANGRFPAILEYIPYRKRDMVRARDERNHPYFAENGYACLRVDMRGSGDSEGVMPDMYTADELDDARHVINWIAAQPWCNGRVGMFGTSWGGTAGLQAAVDAPNPLKAVIANCATIDRFEDDIHWMGGCLLTDSLEWGATLPAILAAPPDRATVGENWMQMWKSRLENLAFPHENWIAHRTRGDYWRHGSVRFAADRLTCPILAVGGWSDRYSNSVVPLVRARPDLCWGIVGPWGHHYPDHGEPGPAISFQDVVLEWWDHWLKPAAPAAPEWPSLRLWRREFDPPQNRLEERRGGWIKLRNPAEVEPGILHLGNGTLENSSPHETVRLAVPFDIRHGECAGDTGYFGRVGGQPLDQSADDARALCFDSAPLVEAISLVGSATLCLKASTRKMPAQLVCRLCDVAPDGRSNLVTRTILNLELDEGLDARREFRPDRLIRYRIKFPTTAYRFLSGHRLRLALASSYWPLVWPTSEPAGLQVSTTGATLALPEHADKAKASPSSFPPPKDLPKRKTWAIHSPEPLQRVPAAVVEDCLTSSWRQPSVTLRFESIDVALSYQTSAEYSVPSFDPARAICEIRHEIEIRRSDGIANVQCCLRAGGLGTGRQAAIEISAGWNDEEIFKARSVLTF